MMNATHCLVTDMPFAEIKCVVFYLLSHICMCVYIYIFFFFFLSAKLRETVA